MDNKSATHQCYNKWQSYFALIVTAFKFRPLEYTEASYAHKSIKADSSVCIVDIW